MLENGALELVQRAERGAQTGGGTPNENSNVPRTVRMAAP
jgi:hypothetical protein